MYLIHFHSKNVIKMHFPKSLVFKVSKPLQTFIIHLKEVKQIALTSAKTSQHYQCNVVNYLMHITNYLRLPINCFKKKCFF